MGALAVALALLARPADATLVRESRPAMGTLVGITVPVASPADEPAARAAIADGFAAIEAWEAQLSEWRPDSLTTRINAGEAVVLPSLADLLFTRAEALRVATDGAFSLTWQGGALSRDPTGAWRSTGPVGLGGILKGFLVDRAADALSAAHVTNFLVDAAGDLRAAGDLGDGREGWPVTVRRADGRLVTRVRLHDAALSTSGDDRQPGHIHDPRTGASIGCTQLVTIVAPSGAVADSLATALFAACGAPGLAESLGASALRIDADGHREWSTGARRVLR